MITGLWATPDGEAFSYDGEHSRLSESPALPKPHQRPGPPVIVGGHGARRTPSLAARFAAEFNVGFSDEATTGQQFERVRAACGEVGRDPDDLVMSAAQVVCCGESEEAVRRRADAIGRDADQLRADGLAGTPAEVVDKIGRYAALGAERVYLQVLDQHDLDHLRLLAAEVVPQV